MALGEAEIEILDKVFVYLNLEDLLSASKVCRHWLHCSIPSLKRRLKAQVTETYYSTTEVRLTYNNLETIHSSPRLQGIQEALDNPEAKLILEAIEINEKYHRVPQLFYSVLEYDWALKITQLQIGNVLSVSEWNWCGCYVVSKLGALEFLDLTVSDADDALAAANFDAFQRPGESQFPNKSLSKINVQYTWYARGLKDLNGVQDWPGPVDLDFGFLSLCPNLEVLKVASSFCGHCNSTIHANSTTSAASNETARWRCIFSVSLPNNCSYPNLLLHWFLQDAERLVDLLQQMAPLAKPLEIEIMTLQIPVSELKLFLSYSTGQWGVSRSPGKLLDLVQDFRVSCRPVKKKDLCPGSLEITFPQCHSNWPAVKVLHFAASDLIVLSSEPETGFRYIQDCTDFLSVASKAMPGLQLVVLKFDGSEISALSEGVANFEGLEHLVLVLNTSAVPMCPPNCSSLLGEHYCVSANVLKLPAGLKKLTVDLGSCSWLTWYVQGYLEACAAVPSLKGVMFYYQASVDMTPGSSPCFFESHNSLENISKCLDKLKLPRSFDVELVKCCLDLGDLVLW